VAFWGRRLRLLGHAYGEVVDGSDAGANSSGVGS
jgi:hypothetical protein